MRNLMNKTIIFSLLVTLTACNDWLNVSPKTDMKADDLFATEAGFRDALIGVYALMCRSNAYGRDLTYGYLDVLAQYYNSPLKTTSSGYEHNFKNTAEYKYTESGEESKILSIWENQYAAVVNINQALNYIDKNLDVFTASKIHDVYKGELLALRAMLHFDVLRLFAPAPGMDNNTGLDALAIPYVEIYTNVAQPQLTVREVLVKIEKDLLAAKELMKDKEDFDEKDSSMPMYNRGQRMNYYAVTALLARVYLYANDKGKALAEAKEIIGEANGEKPTSYQLATSSATPTDPMFRPELIFTLDVQKLKDLSDVYFTESFSSTANILTMSANGKKNVFNSSGLDNEFRNVWLTIYSDGTSSVLSKYKDMKYIPVFKISELYLIAAECAGSETGFAYLNELRNHRGLVSVFPSGDLDNYIFQEYRREFLGEGQMFFYYKRKGFDKIGAEDNIAIEDLKAVYNLPVPKVEVEFGKIK